MDKPIDDFYYSSGAGIILPPGIKTGRYESMFRMKLSKAGLTGIHVDVLTHVFVYEDTAVEATRELGIASVRTFKRLKREALAFLKEKGFK